MSNTISDRILFEDNHLLAFNKLAGELVQGDKTGDQPLLDTLKNFIKERDAKPGNVFLGAPHRIDRPVSGVVIFAKTSKALTRLNEAFREKQVQKLYWAIVSQPANPPSGRLHGWMQKNEKQNKSYVSETEKSGYKEAVLHYKTLASSDRYHLLEVHLETGRHHQIRAQLAQIGCVIKGDLKYGAPRSNPDASISLHARTAVVPHPVTKSPIHITAPCPKDDLWAFFENATAEKK